VTEPSTPQVSWKAIEADAIVTGADGSQLAQVAEIAGDRTADIFNGLVVRISPLQAKRSLAAEHVVAIWPRRVEVDLTARQIAALPLYDEPVVEQLPKQSWFRRLFG
jgi:hypothetical protein